MFMGVIGRRYAPGGDDTLCAYPDHHDISKALFNNSYTVLEGLFTDREKRIAYDNGDVVEVDGKEGALCAACLQPLPSTGKWCMGCFTNVMLCDKKCQRKYWKNGHKHACSPTAKLVVAYSTTEGVEFQVHCAAPPS